ncbi:MAG: hypothetical protein Q4C51_02630 [Clostridia bacterium]|nr:hypothetical protein [Clostridia bacterium]
MRQEIWKMIKTNFALAKDEFSVMLLCMAIGTICLLMLNMMFQVSIIGLVLIIVAIFFHEKTINKIFFENAYGNSSILIDTFPVQEQSIRAAKLILGAMATFYMLICGFIVVSGCYMVMHDGLGSFPNFLRWLYFNGSKEVSNIQVYTVFSLALVSLLILSICASLCTEFLLVRTHGKYENEIAMLQRMTVDLPVALVMIFIFLPSLLINFSNEISPILVQLLRIAVIVGLAILFYRWSSREGDNRSKPTDSIAFGSNKNLTKVQAYGKLISGEGLSIDWSIITWMIAMSLLFFKQIGIKAIWVLIAIGICNLTSMAQAWNSYILLDDKASFFGSFPISNRDRVKAHMIGGFKFMVTLPVFFLIVTIIGVFFNKGTLLFSLMSDFVGSINGSLELYALCAIWLLIITAITFAFSGWAFFNSLYASYWRDPITRRTSKVAGMICIIVEALVNISALKVIMPFKYLDPIIGSLIFLGLAVGECFLANRLAVINLRDKYNV